MVTSPFLCARRRVYRGTERAVMTEHKLRLGALIAEGYGLKAEKLWPTYTGGYLDRSKYVSASETRKCARQIKFSKARSVPMETWGYAERGNTIEAWAVNLIRLALADDCWTLLLAGESQRSFYHEFQSGTPDGLLVMDNEPVAVAVEFKSIDPRTNYSNLPKPMAVDQVQQNMDLLTRLTPYTVTNALLIYIDASNYQRHKEFVIDADPARQAYLAKRAEIIMTTDAASLPAEGMMEKGGCDNCPFTSECASVTLDAKQIKAAERASKYVFK